MYPAARKSKIFGKCLSRHCQNSGVVLVESILLEVGKQVRVFIGWSDYNVFVAELGEVAGVAGTGAAIRLERSRNL